MDIHTDRCDRTHYHSAFAGSNDDDDDNVLLNIFNVRSCLLADHDACTKCTWL